MLFSEQQERAVRAGFDAAAGRLGEREKRFTDVLPGLNAEEAFCYRFLVGAMPLSDAASCDGGLLLAFVRSALAVRSAVSWGNRIPTELFLNDVLFYRVNDENIEDYRDRFSAEILPRVRNLSMREAALEVNRWCAEKGTYRSSDDRTVSPLTFLRSGCGRCGEESVFTVSALRSVGIPARQCYVPRWSHCDDNHAWVEVWVDGEWHYMGACEPEPELDRGWFTYAASRAMLVRSRVFSNPLPGEKREPVLTRDGCVTEQNELGRYAETAELSVRVLRGTDRPLPGVRVRFQVVNEAEQADLAVLTTGPDGLASLTTGLGTLCVRAEADGAFREEVIPIKPGKNHLIFDFSAPYAPQDGDFDFCPPEGKIPSGTPASPVRETGLRARREAAFFSPETAAKFAERYPAFRKEISGFLVAARGNAVELTAFLDRAFPLERKVELLLQLREKDFADCPASVLEDALVCALPFRSLYPGEVYRRFILSPRVEQEFLFGCRAQLTALFSPERRAAFRKEPEKIGAFLARTVQVRDDLDYGALAANPVGLLQMKTGSARSLRVLYVSLCRAIGVPARLNPMTGRAEFLRGNVWRNPDGSVPRTAPLTLRNEGAPLLYGRDFTVAYLRDGSFHTLRCPGLLLERQAVLRLEPGCCRILLANRQIDGAVLVRRMTARPECPGGASVVLAQRKSDIRTRLHDFPIRNGELEDPEGTRTDLAHAARAPKNILALLDVRAEPTEHLLNEWLEMEAEYRKEDLALILLVPDEQSFRYPLLRKVLAGNPNARVYRYLDPDFRERLFADARAGDRRLPLTVVVDGSRNARFHFANYNVGSAGLLLQVARALSAGEQTGHDRQILQ